MSNIDARDFFQKISEELRTYDEKYRYLLCFYINKIPTIKDCKINVENINTTVDMIQEMFLNRDDINDNEKDMVCFIINKFKIMV